MVLAKAVASCEKLNPVFICHFDLENPAKESCSLTCLWYFVNSTGIFISRVAYIGMQWKSFIKMLWNLVAKSDLRFEFLHLCKSMTDYVNFVIGSSGNALIVLVQFQLFSSHIQSSRLTYSQFCSDAGELSYLHSDLIRFLCENKLWDSLFHTTRDYNTIQTFLNRSHLDVLFSLVIQHI